MTETEENTKLTPARMREWEDRLGPEKVRTAIDILRSHGWGPESAPPMWVYAQAYLMAEGKLPISWGPHRTPTLSESILGFKLF